ncbi:M23 family metallopeptidase [Streptomyces sp. SID10853]|uniref:peptidoglycan DD-metalloendopeptidase family protein n=1 Tax=Streptomyces sp. SID10853 TaxID=2706028 RepID=UPI0013C1BF17|nr:M23 family metallopeptidase [Streptomyces sp. SID10853]
MNDQQTHAGYVGNDGYSAGSPTGSFAVDPLFGDMPGGYPSGAPSGAHGPYRAGGHSGEYDTTQWDTGARETPGYDVPYQQPYTQPQSQSYGHPAHTFAGQDTGGYDTTGQWDTGAYATSATNTTSTYGTGVYGTAAHGADTYDTGTGTYDSGAHDTGAHDATAWNSAGAAAPHPTQQFAAVDLPDVTGPEHTAEFAAFADHDGPSGFNDPELPDSSLHLAGPPADHPADDDAPPASHPAAPLSSRLPSPPGARRAPGGRGGRRRTPAKRSALLTIAVPSACVMGVAGVAAATVGGIGESGKDSGTGTQAAADPSSVKPVAANSKLDGQLADLSHEADDFADRASRTQERIDLKQRQATAKKKAEEEAARKEAARPKFVLPVKQKGLSAYFGQAGVNWMSVHTGIDFPVSYGTPVMAATDGTVRTQWNSAYGNMAMVTSPDGTETWYCHLSSTKIRSGSVKAGDVIAYSGSSGNSTGPHMHFEVRPHSGAAIDPLPWLRSHGLDPT